MGRLRSVLLELGMLCGLVPLLGCPDALQAPPSALEDAGRQVEEPSDVPDAREPVAAPDSSCVRMVLPLSPAPLEILLLVDANDLGDLLSSDPRLVGPIVNLVDRLEPGVKLGAQMFPPREPLDQCDPALLEQPLLEIGPAPQVAAELNAMMRGFVQFRRRSVGSAVRAAVTGALEHLRARRPQDPKTAQAIVLASHGSFFGCYEPYLTLAPLLRQAYEEEGVVTHILGLRVPERQPPGQERHFDRTGMHTLAQAGGTHRAFFVDINGLDESSLLAGAIEATRKRFPSCKLQIPVLPAAEIDKTSVSILFRADQDTEEERWPLRASSDDCQGGRDGAYYVADDTLELCPASCAIARAADSEGALRIDAECVQLLL